MLNNRFYNIILVLIIPISILFVLGYIQDFSIYPSQIDYHLRQSLSLINGYTYLPLDQNFTHPHKLGGDLHFYNGVYYSNWGLGIPFLQLPFHWISISLYGVIFPPALIFIFYTCITSLLLFKFFTRYENNTVSFFISIAIIYFCLYWLIAYRFLIYEQTTAYFSLFIINSLIYFIRLDEDNKAKNIPLLVLNLFLAILMRPTALFIAVFIFLYLYFKDKSLLIDYIKYFTMPALIFMFFSYDKSGGIFPAGMATIHAGVRDELLHNRIGSPCLPGTTIDIYMERFIQFFRAYFISPHVTGTEITSSRCLLIFEDMKGLNKPWISPIIGFMVIMSLIILTFDKKFKKLIFIFSGLIVTLIIYTLLTNGGAYRYSVDFYFYILLALFLLYRSSFFQNIFKIKNIRLLFIFIFAIYLYRYNVIIFENYSSANLSKKSLIYKELTWVYPEAFPLERICSDKSLDKDGFDMMGWSTDCRMEKFINTYIKLPNLNGKYKLIIEGRNLPELFTLRINGRLYENFNYKNDSIYIDKIINNAFNLFIYNKSSRENIFIDKIKLK